jgi:probable phosphoglycerate mutase
VAAIYTSPLKRCVTTASAISEPCGVSWRVLDELTDIDYGEWQFKTYEEMETAHPALFRAWLTMPQFVRFPKGESLQDVIARSADALRLMLDHHAGETVAAVAHDSVNRALLVQLLDQPISCYWRIAQDPCCVNEIDIIAGHVRVRRINATAHLRSVETD